MLIFRRIYNRLLILLAILLLGLFAIAFARNLSSSFYQLFASPLSANKPAVAVYNIVKAPYPVKALLYGTAQAEQSVTLHAPFAGKLSCPAPFHIGQFIKKDTPLYQMDKEPLENSLKQLHHQMSQIPLQVKLKKVEKQRLEEQLQARKQQLLLELEQRDNLLDHSAAERELFSRAESLFESAALSHSELLAKKQKLEHAENSLLLQEQRLLSTQEALDSLHLALEANALEQEQITLNKESLLAKIAQVEYDLARTTVTPPFDSKVTAVHFNASSEVGAGAPLLELRSVAGVEIPLKLSDHYFPWLYSGQLLRDLPTDLTVHLVNKNYKKSFGGALLQAAGAALNVPSRSLPLLLYRANPLDTSGRPIAEEELLPGMYCEVSLQLDVVEDAYIIPLYALQEGLYLYSLEESEEEEALKKIEDFTILFQEGSSLVVQIPNAPDTLRIVVQQVAYLSEGTKVEAVEAQ